MSASFLLYSTAKVIKGIVPFLFLPLILKLISLEQFGLFSYIEVLVISVTQLVVFGAHQVISDKFQTLNKKSILVTVFKFLSINSILAIILLIPFLWQKLGATNIAALFFLLLLYSINLILNVMTKISGAPKKVLVSEALIALFKFGLGWVILYFILPSHFSLLISFVIGLLLGNMILLKGIKTTSSDAELEILNYKDLLTAGKYVLLYSIAAYVMAMSDRVMIESILGMKQVAVYSIGYKVGSVLQMLTLAYISSIMPKIYGEKNKTTSISVKNNYVLALFGSGIAISIVSYIYIKNFLPEATFVAFYISLVVLLSNVFHGINALNYHLLNLLDKKKELATLALVAALTNIILNYFMINHYQEIGAAYATAIAYFILMVGMFVLVKKKKQVV